MTPRDDSPTEPAHRLVERIFALLGESRTVQGHLMEPGPSESPSAQAERELYSTLLAALVRAMEDALRVLQNAVSR